MRLPEIRARWSGRRSLGVLALAALATSSFTPTAVAGEDPDDKIRVWTKHTDEGDIIALARVPVAAATIREFLADGERAHKLAPTTLGAKASADGRCQRVDLTIKGLFSPFKIQTRRCPTAKGTMETMVASDDFEDYTVEWVVQEVGDASLVSIRTRNTLSISVPEGMLIRQSKKVMASTVRNLVIALGVG